MVSIHSFIMKMVFYEDRNLSWLLISGRKESDQLVLHQMKNRDVQRKDQNEVSKDMISVMMEEMCGEKHPAIHRITSMVMVDLSRDTGTVSVLTSGSQSTDFEI